MKKVILGLSGGVDSAVCVRLLRDCGFDVLGVFLTQNGTCPKDAHTVARHLDIPLEIVDITNELENYVCKPFARGYLRGETPNPCIVCNPAVKFPALINAAERAGADFIATGHYANTGHSASGRFALLKGTIANDQSYMLYRLSQTQLAKVIFPLGKYEKCEVRKLAEKLSLPVAKKPDSMEICFIPDNDYASYIERYIETPPPGDFIDETGKILGKHRGIHHYTIGQRRGLEIAAGKRIFVSNIDPEDNTVTLCDNEKIFKTEIKLRDINWVSIPESLPLRAAVKIRHSKNESPALIEKDEDSGGLRVKFDEPVRAPVTGQSAVFYDGDLVLGGGFIL